MKIILSFLAIVMVVGFSNKVIAQVTNTSDTENTAVYAKLIRVMTIEEDASLSFGTIVLTDAAVATVKIATDGTQTIASGAAAISASDMQPETAAAYHVTGTASEAYVVTFSSMTNVLATTTAANGSGTATQMSVTDITVKFNTGSDQTSGYTSSLSEAGTDNFTVGGLLNINEAQIAGIYNGTFDVTVDYN